MECGEGCGFQAFGAPWRVQSILKAWCNHKLVASRLAALEGSGMLACVSHCHMPMAAIERPILTPCLCLQFESGWTREPHKDYTSGTTI